MYYYTVLNNTCLHCSWIQDGQEMRKLCLNCTEKGLPAAVSCIDQWADIKPTMEVLQLTKVNMCIGLYNSIFKRRAVAYPVVKDCNHILFNTK